MGGWKFQTRPADVDENQQPGEAAGAYVLRLAESKAHACAGSAQSEEIILAADTAVIKDNDILGKPKDLEAAAEMLRNLRGRIHQVYTGIAVLRLSDGALVTDLCITDVPMRAYRDDEIDAYVATGDPLDKAGAYAIQNAGFHPVEWHERLLCQRDGTPALPPNPQPAKTRHPAPDRYCRGMPVRFKVCLFHFFRRSARGNGRLKG